MKAPKKVQEPSIASFEEMANRFRERAQAIEKYGMPPLEGEMRRKWVRQK